MTTEEEYTKILLDKGLTELEIKKKVKSKIKDMSGLIDEKTALHVLIKEIIPDYLEKTEKEDIEIKEYSIKKILDLKEEFSMINTYGIVKEIGDIREFNKKDGSKGKITSISLVDSEMIKLTLWDKHTELIPTLKEDMIVNIINCKYEPEKGLTLNPKGTIELNVKRSVEDKWTLPTIKDIKPGQFNLHINCQYLGKEPIMEFASGSKKQTINLSDETGFIQMVVWNNTITTFGEIPKGSTIELLNVLSGKKYNSTLPELVFHSGSVYHILEVAKDYNNLVEINSLSEGIYSIIGRIVSIETIIITAASGRESELTKIVISDETKAVMIKAWGMGEALNNLMGKGDVVEIKDILFELNTYSNLIEGTINKNSKISISDKKIGLIHELENNKSKAFTYNFTSIKDIDKEEVFEIKGTIKEISDSNFRFYESCKKCLRKEENCICEEGCQDSKYSMILNLYLRDDTDTMNITLFDKLAQDITGLDTTSLMLDLNDESNRADTITDLNFKLAGPILMFIGLVKFDDVNERYKMRALNFELHEEETPKTVTASFK